MNPSSTPPASTEPRARIASVDLLRGLAILLMALGHTRIFLSHDLISFYPWDLEQTRPALFLVQWLGRFGSPAFFLLAGAAIFFFGERKSKYEVSRFLLIRGAWLILLELTWVKFAWLFQYDPTEFGGSVLWALGWSMIALAGLIWAGKPWLVGGFGAIMIATHNLFDGVTADQLGSLGWLWKVLHEPGAELEPFTGVHLHIFFALIPWIGVMAAGYALGPLLRADWEQRQKWLLRLGTGLITGFLILRLTNRYGDPIAWSGQTRPVFTLLSFLNCETFPPSLDHLLLTLSALMIALVLLDREQGVIGRFILVFGRVPLFFYLLHIALIHGIAVLLSYARYGEASWLIGLTPDPAATEFYPADYGYGFAGIFLVWLIVVLLMYPICRWFVKIKRDYDNPWLTIFS